MMFKQIGAALNRAAESKRTSLLLCLIAGAVGALPYFYESLFVFTFISLVAIFAIAQIQRQKSNRVFAPFFWYHIGFFAPLYLFLSEMYPYTRFGFSGNQAIFILICSCIAIPCLHALVCSAVMMISKLFSDKAISIIGYASLWVISEWVLSLGKLAFPWCGVAVSLTGFLPYLQTASLFGKYFITFITAIGCCAISYAIVKKAKLLAYIGATAIIVNAVIGTILWFIPINHDAGIKAAVLQGNILSNEKWDSENKGSIFDRYISMTEEAAENGAKIIVLPETAITQYFTENGKLHNAFADIANRYDVHIIAGIHAYNSQTKQSYNAVIGVAPDGSLSERYDKRHLVPFGEFIPFAEIIGKMVPFVGEFNEGTSNLGEGTEAVIIETKYGNLTPLVCFDSIFSQFACDGVNDGAEMIAIVTNDSWFNDSNGIYTHLRHAQLRAIENKRFILRAANTGVSAFIDESGRIIEQTEPLTDAIAYSTVYKNDSKTPYTLIGDIVLYVSFIIVIYLATLYINNRRKENGNNSAS